MTPAQRASAGTGTIACCAGAVSCVVALHLLRPDLDPLSRRLSEYANGPYGPVMTAAFWLLAAGSLALAWDLRRTVRLHGAGRLVPRLLAVAAAGLIVAGLFRTQGAVPATPSEIAHSRGSGSALVALIAAAVLLSRGEAAEPALRGGPTALALLALAVGAASPLLHDSQWTGAVQRLLGLALVSWLVLTAARVRRLQVSRGVGRSREGDVADVHPSGVLLQRRVDRRRGRDDQ